MLPLRDGKKAAGILFVKIIIGKDETQGIHEEDFKIFKPFKKCEYCLPKEFSMTSSNDSSHSYMASFVNSSNGVSFETVLKEFKEKIDFGLLSKKIKGETITSLKKKYTNVELMAIRENILPSPHCRNKQIEQMFEFDLFIEHQLVKMWETIRVIGYNNNFIGVFTYGGKDEEFSLKKSVEEMPFLSESIIFQ
ncbi:predicted protein [Naegleria gruberi]|uniref:Predicted protein n=1 Tax=Naegleria gruberi TaxID=5762 RepID=D2W160_NAEGR|nr:uncharacterized protein NAEGRDRAFT_75100 [Naegleria gruberi]EFC37174.1 predicted protein [Naegleria gruberi]|eukprot:XP_002669918.1 predicted protein [Naegleria gruberi strain NEG-M]